jgi:hypothetical protein
MTVIVTTTNTRPFPTVNFAALPDNIIGYIKTTYQDTGKLLSIDSEFSDDRLVRTTTLVFSDPAALSDYNHDTTLVAAFTTIRDYNSFNGISHRRNIVNA